MKFIPSKSMRSLRALKIIFSALVVVMVVLSFFTYNTFINYGEEVNLRVHSNQIIRALKEVELEVYKAEAGHRGFQLTRNPDYLEPYLSSKEVIMDKLTFIDSLILKKRNQEQRVDSLSILVQRQFLVIEEIIAQAEDIQTQPFSQYEANLLVLGRQNLTAIQKLMDEIEQAEKQFLDARISGQQTQGILLPVMLTIFNILSLAIIIYVFYYVYRLLSDKIKAEEELKQRQVQLLEAERMVNIGNWTWELKSGKVEWSEGLYQIFNKPSMTYKPNHEQLVKHIHPEDREAAMETINEAVKNHEPYEVNYRHKMDDGSLKYVYSIGNPNFNIDGELVGYFGVTQDVTPQKNIENRLLQQSQELKRSNEDLEQFAYVASHDLQEPLRKIRAFGDRLESKYHDKLEGSGADYISRMKNAAERMQGLINDLLTFSRVSRTDQEFKKHSLNEIIAAVVEDMETSIAENNARVDFGPLPEIMCNYQEIKRLFQNIIGNAIKFKKPDEDPVITIRCSEVRASEVVEEFPVKGNRQYYSITIADNGIGFNKKYQERIFNIFQRLHGRSEYKGTGIGLAICRKIVTNHEGFISARGEENKGAKFTILLPRNFKKEAHQLFEETETNVNR